MSEEIQKKFEQRLARYQAAIALEIPDRIPISSGSNYFAEVYAGKSKQQFVYDSSQWLESDRKFVNDFPEVDNLRSGRFWGPLIDAGYTIRAYLEGDWGANWHHFREMPRGKIFCDIDVKGDIFKAKEDLKGYQCIAGGMPDSMLITGTPDKVRARTKLLCETVGRDGGYIINGGCGIPYDTKPENYRAMINAILEYGCYRDSIDFEPQINPNPPEGWTPLPKGMITPWEIKRDEMREIKGDEDLIKAGGETLEHMAFNWLWTWIW